MNVNRRKRIFCLIGPIILKRKAVRLTLKYYFGLEQRPGDPPGDGQQFPLAGKYPACGSFAGCGQVDRAAMSGSGGTFRRSHDRGKFRQYQSRMEEKLVERVSALGLFQLLQAVRFVNRELTDSRAFERGKMSSASQLFS